MASPVEGYEDERFETAVPHNFHCAICLNVLKQPIQCMRNEHSFCKPCITRYLEEFKRCPTCMERLTLQTLRPSRIITDLMSQFKITCDNFKRGCTVIVKLEMLDAHVADCGFSPIQCSNEGCEMIINRKDLEQHDRDDCHFRKEKCEVCGMDVPHGRRKLHCYVTRAEIDEVRQEISSIKEIVTNLSRELTRHMYDVKDRFDHINHRVIDLQIHMNSIKYEIEEVKNGKQMADLNEQMCDVKHKIDKVKKKVQNIKQQPQSSVHSLGLSVPYLQQNMNIRDIVIAGGFSKKSVEMFSWTTGQWTHLPPMTSERCLSSSFVHQGQIFVCGGRWKGSIEVLNLKEEGAQWKNFTVELPQEIYGHTSVVYGNNLFIFGGRDHNDVFNDIYKVCLVYPYSLQWFGNMPEPRTFHSAQRFGDKIVIVGGTTGRFGSSDPLDTVLLYDITKNCCQTLTPLPFAVCEMATVAWKDNIVIIGGYDKNGNALNSVVAYNITAENSKMLPPMKHKRSSCTAVLVDNIIVVMGGWNNKERNLSSVESFNFDSYVWEELPLLKEGRKMATGVVKCDF